MDEKRKGYAVFSRERKERREGEPNINKGVGGFISIWKPGYYPRRGAANTMKYRATF
jgi:hypothetical protein